LGGEGKPEMEGVECDWRVGERFRGNLGRPLTVRIARGLVNIRGGKTWGHVRGGLNDKSHGRLFS